MSAQRRRLLGGGVVLGAVLALGLLGGQACLMVELGWANRAAAGNPEFGINYSCDYAEYLLLEDPALGEAGYVPDDRPGRVAWCAQTLEMLLTGLGARHVRLSIQWSQVEPRDGIYDFTLIDALLAAAERNGATVLLTVGMRAQRHPEFYIPAWALAGLEIEDGATLSSIPELRERALRMVANVVDHVSASPAIEAWMAENEPFKPTARAASWELSREYVREVVATIRAHDPAGRPIAINHAQHFVFDRTWRWTVEDADIAATSIFPFRPYSLLGGDLVFDVLQLGPLTPNYPAHAEAAREAGKRYWITEMQAEPWAKPDVRRYGPENRAEDLPPGNFAKSVEYGRRSGAERVYLWGAECWLFQRDIQGDAAYWEIAREAISGVQP